MFTQCHLLNFLELKHGSSAPSPLSLAVRVSFISSFSGTTSDPWSTNITPRTRLFRTKVEWNTSRFLLKACRHLSTFLELKWSGTLHDFSGRMTIFGGERARVSRITTVQLVSMLWPWGPLPPSIGNNLERGIYGHKYRNSGWSWSWNWLWICQTELETMCWIFYIDFYTKHNNHNNHQIIKSLNHP